MICLLYDSVTYCIDYFLISLLDYYVISKLVYLFTYLPFQTVALVPVRDDTADDVLAGHHVGPSFGIKRKPEVVP